jgi:hypothetical protein
LAILGSATMALTDVRIGWVLLSDVLFAAAAVAIVIKSLVGDDSDLAPPSARKGSALILVGAVLLLAAGTLSSFRSWDPTNSLSVVLRFGWVTLVWFWIMRTVCRDRRDLFAVLRAWKWSALITGTAAVLGYMGIAFISEESGDRQVGVSGHPNHLAGQLAATFCLFLLAVPPNGGVRRRRDRFAWFASLGLCATAIMASGSMTGLLAVATAVVAVGVAIVATRRPRQSRRPRSPLAPVGVLLLMAAGVGLLATSDLPVLERIGLYREGDAGVTGSVDTRSERNDFVLQRFDQYLVVGLGFSREAGAANIPAISGLDDPANRNYGVHNMHLGLLYQAGLAAVIGAAVILYAAWRQLMVLLRRTDAELYMVTLALLGAFVAVNVNSLFQPTAFDRFYWMPVAMTGVLWSIRRRELQAEALAIRSLDRATFPRRRRELTAGVPSTQA